MRRNWHIVALLLVMVGALPRAASAQAISDLSIEELHHLEKGQLVTRRQESAGEARLFGGTSWQKVDVPPEAVWEAILDTSHYDRMLPQLEEARLIRDDTEARLVLMHHRQGLVSASYHLVMQPRPRSRFVTFYVDPSRPGALSQGQGYIMVRPYGERSSVVTFHVMADVGSGLIARLFQDQIQEWMLRVPQTMRRYVEGPGRTRYLRLAMR
jgi:carbon monoxide dehydrogenase subunit G